MSEPNDLERAILDARAGTLSQQEFVERLVHSRIAVPSRVEVRNDLSEARPILLDKGNETFVAAFTDVAYVSDYRHLAGYCLEIDVLAWIRVMPRNIGLVLNPGREAALQLSAEGVQQIVRNYSPVPIQ